MTTSTMTLTEFLIERFNDDMARAASDLDHFFEDTAYERWIRKYARRLSADTEAKRRIVEVCNTEIDAWPAADSDLGFDEVLEALALPYADHPDFREEWR